MHVVQTLTFLGPNRHSDNTLIEQRISLDDGDSRVIASLAPGLRGRIEQELPTLAGPAIAEPFAQVDDLAGDPVVCLLLEYARTAVLLQRLAGHRVDQTAVIRNSGDGNLHVLWEHEDSDVGRASGILALRLICLLEPGLVVRYHQRVEQNTILPGPADLPFQEQLGRFLDDARSRLLPIETQALIDAARRRNIPCIKLDREPYEGISGDFRIRPNAMMMFGHCRFQQIVDGTFSVQRATHLSPLIANRVALAVELSGQGVPLAEGYRGSFSLTSDNRIRRAARQLGYPLVVKPSGHANGRGVTVGVVDEQELSAALDKARRYSPGVMLERPVDGRTIRLFVIGFKHVCTLGKPDGEIVEDFTGDDLAVEDLSGQVHASLAALAVQTAHHLDAGILVMTVVMREISEPLQDGNGAVVNVDLAPWLDRFLPADSPWLGLMAERFLSWLIPLGEDARIPTIAVTGTNGKTTTCRMLVHMMQTAGRNTGLACTEGVYINNDHVHQADIAILDGHYKVFESPLPDVAILEHHHAGLVGTGVASPYFDVVVCGNVTADHLGHYGIHNVGQMAEVKRSLPERGRVVVLNADDPRCVAMIPHLSCHNICLVSLQQHVDALAGLTDIPASFCCVEKIDGEDWIVLIRPQQRWPLLPVATIPATFDGKARFNTLNAMHAISAAILSGIDVEKAIQAMRDFRMSVETTPGRLNVFDNLPFKVIVDYAHNPDGIRSLGAFVQQIETAGKKIFLFAGSGDRTDELICETALAATGYFDHYALRDYSETRGRPAREIPDLMHQALLKAGIPESCISLHYDAAASIGEVLQMARSGDVVTIAAGTSDMAKIWGEIAGFAPDPERF